jgi:hydrogenase maturation protein HypF
MLIDQSRPLPERAAHFHLAMAHTVLAQAQQIREDTGVNAIGLSGGVFQNRVLTEKCIALLENAGFDVTLPLLTPVNDGGISFGQIVEYGYTEDKR